MTRSLSIVVYEYHVLFTGFLLRWNAFVHPLLLLTLLLLLSSSLSSSSSLLEEIYVDKSHPGRFTLSTGKLIPTFRRVVDSLCLEGQAVSPCCAWSDYGETSFLRQVGNYLPVEKSWHLRECQFSSKRLWELQTSLKRIYFIIDNYKSYDGQFYCRHVWYILSHFALLRVIIY